MNLTPVVLKVSGHAIDSPDFLESLANAVSAFSEPVIIVHGGGKEITHLQARLGIEPRYVDGVRITDEETLSIVEMVLCGTVNKRLVRYLVRAGIDAVGMSGVDRGLVQAAPMPHESLDMGYTGDVMRVRGEILLELLERGVTPVIAPVCYGMSSNFNVNADHVTGAIAGAVNARRVIFLTNVDGVLKDNQVLPSLTPAEVQSLIADGTISGGMIPKVTTALNMLERSVPQAVITSLNGLQSHGGTILTQRAG